MAIYLPVGLMAYMDLAEGGAFLHHIVPVDRAVFLLVHLVHRDGTSGDGTFVGTPDGTDQLIVIYLICCYHSRPDQIGIRRKAGEIGVHASAAYSGRWNRSILAATLVVRFCTSFYLCSIFVHRTSQASCGWWGKSGVQASWSVFVGTS